MFLRGCASGALEFSRLPDSATLAPLHMVELISRQGRVGADDRRYDRLWRQLTLGSVIFQSVFLSFKDPVRWVIRWR
jgi:hypothetical protein